MFTFAEEGSTKFSVWNDIFFRCKVIYKSSSEDNIILQSFVLEILHYVERSQNEHLQ